MSADSSQIFQMSPGSPHPAEGAPRPLGRTAAGRHQSIKFERRTSSSSGARRSASSTATTTSSARTAASTTPAPGSTAISSSGTPTASSSTTSQDGRRVHLFAGAGGEVEYVTELVIDDDEPLLRDRGARDRRRAAAARLRVQVPPARRRRPAVPLEARRRPRAWRRGGADREPLDGEVLRQPVRRGVRSERREQELVLELEAYLRRQGHDAARLKIVPAGERRPIFCDVYDKTAACSSRRRAPLPARRCAWRSVSSWTTAASPLLKRASHGLFQISPETICSRCLEAWGSKPSGPRATPSSAPRAMSPSSPSHAEQQAEKDRRENVCAAIVSEVLGGAWRKRDVRGGPPGLHDYDIEFLDGHIEALEVCAFTDGPAEAQRAALDGNKEFDSQVLTRRWFASIPDRGLDLRAARTGDLLRAVESQFAVLESHGRYSFYEHEYWEGRFQLGPHHPVFAAADALVNIGIRDANSSSARGHLAGRRPPRVDRGVVHPASVNVAVEDRANESGNVAKLRAATHATATHIFIPIYFGAPLTFLALEPS